MASAAKRGRKRRLRLDFVRLAAAVAVLVAIVLILAPDPIKTGIGVPLLLGAGTVFILAHFRTKVRDELEIEDIVAEPNEALQHDLRALAEFRNLIASGDIPCAEMLPDGTLKPLTPKALRAFVADHGALLVPSRDQALWHCTPHRPAESGQAPKIVVRDSPSKAGVLTEQDAPHNFCPKVHLPVTLTTEVPPHKGQAVHDGPPDRS